MQKLRHADLHQEKGSVFTLTACPFKVAKMPNSLLARTTHPEWATWTFNLLLLVLIVCLVNSASDMYGHSFNPTCMDGTIPNTYSGQNPPNAPNAESRPFCTSATANSFAPFFLNYGFQGVGRRVFSDFIKVSFYEFFPFERLGENSSCPSAADENADSLTVTVQGDRLAVTDSRQTTNFNNALSRLNDLGFGSISTSNNAAFQLTGASTTYYLRQPSSPEPSSLPTFRVARTTRDPPLDAAAVQAAFGSSGTAATIKFFTFSPCASQFRRTFRSGPGDSHINADGTLKTSNGGMCLVQATQTAVQVSIPGLIGSAIALTFVLCIIMEIPAVRKLPWFNILFVCINVLSLILMIAAVALGAAVLAGFVAPCLFQTDFSSDQVAPSPTRAAINGFTPSSGGFNMNSVATPQSRFQAVQSGNAAVYMRPTFDIGSGAGWGITFIVLQFIFTIYFGIKIDWAEANQGQDSDMVSVQMTPK